MLLRLANTLQGWAVGRVWKTIVEDLEASVKAEIGTTTQEVGEKPSAWRGEERNEPAEQER